MFISIFKTIFLLIYFFFNEIKLIRKKIINLYVFFINTKVISYYLGKFSTNKNMFRKNEINTFIDLNIKINKIKIDQKFSTKKKIIVESFINHPLYTLPNCIIGKYLSDITKLECLGVIRNGDISAENIMKSYGIKTIFKINQGNFFLRLYFFCKAIKIIGFNKSIKKLIKLRFNKIQIGRDIYEHYTRFSRDPGPKK